MSERIRQHNAREYAEDLRAAGQTKAADTINHLMNIIEVHEGLAAESFRAGREAGMREAAGIASKHATTGGATSALLTYKEGKRDGAAEVEAAILSAIGEPKT